MTKTKELIVEGHLQHTRLNRIKTESLIEVAEWELLTTQRFLTADDNSVP